MSKIELGSVGLVLSPESSGAFVTTAAAADEMGYSTIWLTGGPLGGLQQIVDVVRATGKARVGSAIISVDRFTSAEVSGLYAMLESEHPGRFAVGLGGAHGSDPMSTLVAYLDQLDDTVPPSARLLAALGPRMLDLARARASGALPVLVTPEYTTTARARLGDDTTLAVEQLVVLETDPHRARDIARVPLRFLGQLPAYQANFRRMGFADDDITQLGDRLVDALVVWGDVDAVAGRVDAHRDAGADHVAISVLTASPEEQPVDQLRTLAEALITA